VKGCFDEIVVVDTGSTDETKSIAASYGCEVFDFEWVSDFSKARNFAFSKATCDYIMWLDCDDELASRENFIQLARLRDGIWRHVLGHLSLRR
jgi:glycosyltransferase involved in cell wall biosynthesis